MDYTKLPLDELRKYVKQRQRAANNKISRLRGQGVEVAGSKFDVRRDAARYGKYNRRQLEAQARKLNSFMSRKSGFVQLGDGSVITSKQWRGYVQSERKFNGFRKDYFNRVSNIKLGRMSIGDRILQQTPRNPKFQFASSQKSWLPISRDPRAIASVLAMKKLASDLQKKASPEYMRRQAKQGRARAEEMLSYIGEENNVKQQIDQLTDDEWELLWNTPGFADELSIIYTNNEYMAKNNVSQRERQGNEAINKNSYDAIQGMVESIVQRRNQ